MTRRYFLPRPLHPFAWWGYALSLAVLASSTTNPLLLLGLVAVLSLVVFARRGDNPWAKGFKLYLMLGLFIIAFRLVVRVLFGGGDGPTILFSLPEIPLPDWVAGIRLLGPVSLESLLNGFYDGLRLATMIICIGAANSLVNPKRLLASLPSALYELGTILIVSFSVFPQLADSFTRVIRVRRLRKQRTQGKSRRQRLAIVETIVVPVLSDALDRSVALAASMEVRGYGRGGSASVRERALATSCGLGAIVLLGLWSFVILSPTAIGPIVLHINVLEVTLLVGAVVLVVAAMRVIGRHVRRTRYRKDRWKLAETIALACGLMPLALVTWMRRFGDPTALNPTIVPLEWPTLTLPLLGILLAAALPAFLTPEPALSTGKHTQEGLS